MGMHEILATLDAKQQNVMSAVPQTLHAAMTWESIRQGVGMAIEQSPGGRLGKCDPRTVYTSVLYIVRLGLDCSGYTGQAYLVPFWSTKRGRYECQPIIGVQGKIELAYRSGHIDRIVTGVIHERDSWSMDLAAGELHHAIDLRLEDRGPGLAGYARVWTRGAALPNQEVMTAAEFDQIEAAASKRTRGNLSPAYKEWRDEMWRRSALNRALKRCPKSPDLMAVLSRESEMQGGVARGVVLDATWEDAGAPEDADDDGPLISERPPAADPAPREREREPVTVDDVDEDELP